ncbi:hypothetical protein HDV06_002223 [Boothiomyces sp. JEL0866]|nr:hypothetical protein HDV06_002223 [Boothiomyces sp. JEL0866]
MLTEQVSQELPAEDVKPQKKVWYEVVIIITFVHLVSIYALIYHTPKPATVWLTFLTWVFGGLGITMGYHRLWSHNSYKAAFPVRLGLALMGTLAFEGSIKWWSLRHRLHHRYTDTEHDPYDATRGFWYSHMGWMFEKKTYPRMKWIDQSDLNEDKVVRWQHKHFPALAIVLGLVLPTVLGYTWGDALGGFLYGGYITRIILWHTTWFINSLAHSWGEQEYSNENTSRGNLVLALFTMGEGHHNYHHEFPRDYRNGIKALDWDPTKWAIAFFSFFGATYNLITIPDQVVLKARINTAQDEINKLRKLCIWSDEAAFPTWTMEEFHKECEANELIIIDGFAIDVSEFKNEHPGGDKLITSYLGKDASKSFYGVLNNHSKSARQLMGDMRVARVQPKIKEE